MVNPCTGDDLLHSLFLLKSLLNSEFGKKSDSEDLTMPEYALMRQFALEDDTTDLTSVREYLAVTKASVSQMLASLEKRGLLVRQIDPTNRRNLIVTLTSEGIERLRQKEFQVERRLRELLAELGETDALQFITLINKMNTVLSKKKEEH
ncbi:MAG TPA: winged helix DNA-binding protein [Candidatus Faecalibacterium faecipullorum]|uniref:Winged helix DNA-binding protein n=1 Tax=Candidatus Faecalibacterium faecipullorum TaxID=2838578 RepID=A0A9D2MEL7_9FIRM|nr:winged helix DNA-binding protein [Candidatus Faecalibacterium faecipullorum]